MPTINIPVYIPDAELMVYSENEEELKALAKTAFKEKLAEKVAQKQEQKE